MRPCRRLSRSPPSPTTTSGCCAKACNAAVVDPGDAAPVAAFLDRERLALTAIINTHHHGDHVGGNEDLLARGAVPVFGPAAGAHPRHHPRPRRRRHDRRSRHRARARGARRARAHGRATSPTSARDGGDGAPVAFVGDTLFAGGCGRLFEGTPAQMSESLSRLAALPGATRVYCAHEYTLANLRFALAVEPGNAALRGARSASRRSATGASRRCRRRSPTSSRPIPFLRAAVPEVFAAAAGARGPRARRRRSRRSPRCASGRTHF